MKEAFYAEALGSTGGDVEKATRIAESFSNTALQGRPRNISNARDLVVSQLCSMGILESEITDDRTIGELMQEGTFRLYLRASCESVGINLDDLRTPPSNIIPSQIVMRSLDAYGQLRAKRPGSDLNDYFLSVLSAYCHETYVDKRTAEDFRRARKRDKELHSLIGSVRKGSDFQALVGDSLL